MADKDGKTEQPTAKRLKDTRKKGEVPKSPDLNAAIALAAFTVLLLPLGQFLVGHLFPYLKQTFQHLYLYETSFHDLPQVVLQAMLLFFLLAGPFLLIGFVISILSNLLQVGLLFTSKVLKPNFGKLNPVNGFKQMFSKQALMNMGKTLAKFGVIVYLCYKKVLLIIPNLVNVSEAGTQRLLVFLLTFIHDLFLEIALFMLVIGLIDYMYQRYSHKKRLRMTKQEIKDEFKQSEGDPQVKAQRKAKHREMSRNAIAHVKESTVLITNPTHYAIALKYEPEKEGVPRVLAKGADELAQRMKQEATKHGIPMIENRLIARTLYKEVEPGDFIPVEMYESVAEIIALVYQLEEKKT